MNFISLMLWALFDPLRVLPRWAENLNCKCKYLIKRTQLRGRGSQLSFNPLKLALSPQVVRKSTLLSKKVAFYGQNFQLLSALLSKFATRWEVSPIWACAVRRVLSEYISHTWIISGIRHHPPWTLFQGVYNIGT